MQRDGSKKMRKFKGVEFPRLHGESGGGVDKSTFFHKFFCRRRGGKSLPKSCKAAV